MSDKHKVPEVCGDCPLLTGQYVSPEYFGVVGTCKITGAIRSVGYNSCAEIKIRMKNKQPEEQPEDKEQEQTIDNPARVDYCDSTFYARDGRNHPVVVAYESDSAGPGTLMAQEVQYVGLRCFVRLGGLMLVLVVPRKVMEMDEMPKRFAEDEGFIKIPKLEAFGLIEQISIVELMREYREAVI